MVDVDKKPPPVFCHVHRIPSKTVNTRNQLLLSDLLSDIHLHVLPNETDNSNPTVVPAHRQILASRSDYFLTMFTSDFREGNTNTHTTVVNVIGYSLSTIHSMLEYIYEGKLSQYHPKTLDHQLDLLRISDQYQIPGLQTEITALIIQELSDSTTDKNILYALRRDVVESILPSSAEILREYVVDLLIRDNLSNSTVFGLLECGKRYSEKLKLACGEYVRKNWRVLRKSSEARKWIAGDEDREFVADILTKVG